MNRRCQAIVTVQKGRGTSVQYRVQRVENYTTDESMDQDADTFAIQLGDSSREMEDALDRDNEVQVNLFINDARGNFVPIFTGLADSVDRDKSYTLNVTGRDLPSSLAVDCDALPQRWKRIMPADFIGKQAHDLGISSTQIAPLSQIDTIFTDGTETIWAFWYRIARMKDAYMWTNHLRGGTLIVDKLGYSLTPSYFFGDPPRGQARNDWQPVEEIIQVSTKQGRKRKVIIYGATAKKGKTLGHALVSQAIDITIRDWKKKPISVLTSTVDKTQEELHKRASAEVFEAIVGAVEWQLTIHDTGQLIQQNRMCRINLPHYMPVGNYFVVGVTRQGTVDGFSQIVRVREKGFALSKRVPDAPVLAKTKTSVSTDYTPSASISGALKVAGIRWGDSFVRATREFGGSWDFSVFLGALMAICAQESSFKNIREISTPAVSNIEWYPLPAGPPVSSAPDTKPGFVGPPAPGSAKIGSAATVKYSQDFANDPGNPDNPFKSRGSGNAGVGPMQLTDTAIKQTADNFGFDGTPTPGELDGGRWNPDSNIRAGAKLLVEKAQISPPADPTNSDQIWIAVGRYNAYGPAGYTYRDQVRKLYNNTYGAAALAASTPPVSKSIPPNSTDTKINIPGHGTLSLPENTPDVARKAIAFALRHLGDPYHTAGDGSTYGGSIPLYDCSAFVTAALAQASADIKGELDFPYPGHHGETTTTLFRSGRFNSIPKDALLPADLVFFIGGDGGTKDNPGHVGMYIDDNLFIDDPTTGQNVGVHGLGEEYFAGTYVGARRVVNWVDQKDTSSASGWLTKVGPYEVENLAKPEGGTVDLTKPNVGIMHTTEGSTFSGALSTLDANTDWPTFMVGVEASGAIRVAQFYPFGTAGRAVQHTGDPETNNWARAQIEVVGSSNLTTPWQPTNPTFSALAALLAALSRAPWSIPLVRPLTWGDTYDGTGGRRTSGAWGTQTGWFGHVEIPENSHQDPGQLKYSALFTAAGGY